MKKLIQLMALLLVLMAGSAFAESGLQELPDIPYAEEARLNAAANAPGGTLAFTNPEDPGIWPMLPAEEDGYACLTSANWGVDDSVAAVHVRVEAAAGDALSFWYKTSTETGFDLMQVCVNGDVVKVFTGEGEWGQYAIAFPETGAYEVAFRYSKDTVAAEGSDAVYIRDVQLLSGDAAREALAANPVYPVGTERTLRVVNADAREIAFDDPTFALTTLNGLAKYYIVPAGEVRLHATLATEDDPDGATIRAGDVHLVAAAAAQEGYDFTFPLTAWTAFTLSPSVDSGLMDVRTVVCFPNEKAVNQYLEMLQQSGYLVDSWAYAGQNSCVLTVIDQHGEFIEGVTVSLLTAEGMTLLTSDSEGTIAFTTPAGATASIRVVDTPAGYTFDADRAWTADADANELILDVTRLGE